MGNPNETPQISEQSEKERILSSKEELGLLKEELDNIYGKSITIDYDLGENDHNGFDKMLEVDSTIVSKLEASVDKTTHKKRPGNLNNYITAAKNLPIYVNYLDEETKKLFTENETMIKEISSATEENWDEIVKKYDRDLTKPSGALNLLLAFMRATDICPLGKIDRGKIAEDFKISLKIGGSWDSPSERYAKVELKYPREIVEINALINQNEGLLLRLGDPNLWKEAYYGLQSMFDDNNGNFKKLFEKLYELSESDPASFNAKENYPKLTKILGENLYLYFSSYGTGKVSEEDLSKYAEFKGIEDPKSIDSQMNSPTLASLDNPNFWDYFKGVEQMDQSDILVQEYNNLFENPGIYLQLQKELFNNANVTPEKIVFFLSLSKVIKEFYERKNDTQGLEELNFMIVQTYRKVSIEDQEKLKAKYSTLIAGSQAEYKEKLN